MRRGVQIAVIAVAGLMPAFAAQAQQSPAPPSAYEDLVKRGEAAVIGADWDACVKYFTQAHQLRPSEVTYLAIGRCALERGDYVDALRHLQQGMRFSLTERQRVSVENLKARALQHLGRYRLSLQPPNAALLIGGQPAQPDAEGYVWFQIGRYPVSVSAPGHESMSGELVVQAGDDGVISYNLPALAPQGPVVEPGGGGGAAPSAGEGGSGIPVVPVVVMSIGGALLIGSAVTGAIALGKKGDLDDKCILGENRDLCDPSLADTRDSAKTLALVTDVLWIAGAAAVGTGLLLWLLGSDDEQEAAVNVSAAAGPSGGGLQVAGRF